jgi:hypothetical protein
MAGCPASNGVVKNIGSCSAPDALPCCGEHDFLRHFNASENFVQTSIEDPGSLSRPWKRVKWRESPQFHQRKPKSSCPARQRKKSWRSRAKFGISQSFLHASCVQCPSTAFAESDYDTAKLSLPTSPQKWVRTQQLRLFLLRNEPSPRRPRSATMSEAMSISWRAAG